MPDHHAPRKPGLTGRPAHVLFFAAIPPAEIKARMASAWHDLGTGEAFRHATLPLSLYAVAGMEDLDPVVVHRARQTASALRTAPFTLCFDRLTTFKGRTDNAPLVLATAAASDKLNEIAADLHAACRARGLAGARSGRVVPHVTLAYGRGFAESRMLAAPIFWTIDDVTLIDSLQGQGRHVPLGRWLLPEDRQQPGFDF